MEDVYAPLSSVASFSQFCASLSLALKLSCRRDAAFLALLTCPRDTAFLALISPLSSLALKLFSFAPATLKLSSSSHVPSRPQALFLTPRSVTPTPLSSLRHDACPHAQPRARRLSSQVRFLYSC